jgi:uncharacterized protein (TIGR02246 family)
MPVTQSYELTEDDTIDLEEEQIHKLVLEAMEAWNRHDAPGFTRVYSDDAELTTVTGSVVRGRQAIDEHYAEIFKTIFRKSEITARAVKVRFLSPDIAGVDIRWEMTAALEWDGNVIPIRKGVLHWTVMRERQGWLVKAMHNQELTPLSY